MQKLLLPIFLFYFFYSLKLRIYQLFYFLTIYLLNILGCIVILITTCSYLIFLISQFSFAMSLVFSLLFYSNFENLILFSFIACFSLAFSALTLAFLALILAFLARSLTMHRFNKSSSNCMFNNNIHIGHNLFKLKWNFRSHFFIHNTPLYSMKNIFDTIYSIFSLNSSLIENKLHNLIIHKLVLQSEMVLLYRLHKCFIYLNYLY
jgi:hypothetical protein